jgi:hypothetical protein
VIGGQDQCSLVGLRDDDPSGAKVGERGITPVPQAQHDCQAARVRRARLGRSSIRNQKQCKIASDPHVRPFFLRAEILIPAMKEMTAAQTFSVP